VNTSLTSFFSLFNIVLVASAGDFVQLFPQLHLPFNAGYDKGAVVDRHFYFSAFTFTFIVIFVVIVIITCTILTIAR
jgi:hypothetical protein